MGKPKRRKSTSDSVIEAQLDSLLQGLEGYVGGDVMTICAPIYPGVDDEIRESVEFLCGEKRNRRRKLGVILETSGGLIEVAQRIVQVLRRNYREVDFIVPSHAMSAGTVLALSGDAIHMDYYSVMGPIDPQIENADGSTVPGLGYLAIYNRLIKKAQAGNITTAEVTYLVQRFDPAELYQIEQARQLSLTLLEQWIAKYKFKNWKITQKHRIRVTPKMRKDRAKEIADQLSDPQEWHSHSHGISMAVLRQKLKLVIDDFGENPDFSRSIRGYYELLTHYMMRTGRRSVIHVVGRYTPLRVGGSP
jgi:hypothetical protein